MISETEQKALRYQSRQRDFVASVGLGYSVELLQIKPGRWRAYLTSFVTHWSPRGQAAENKEVARDNYGYIISANTRGNLILRLKSEYPYWRWDI